MRNIEGISLKSRDNHKAWTLVKFYCFSANANPAFGAIWKFKTKDISIPIYSKHAERSQGRKKPFFVICVNRKTR